MEFPILLCVAALSQWADIVAAFQFRIKKKNNREMAARRGDNVRNGF